MRLFNMRSDNFEDVGHWKRRSALGLTYDTEECVLEGGVNQGKMCLCCLRWWLGDGLVRHACQILHLWRHLVILRCWGLRVLRVHFDDQPFADRRVHPPVVGAFNMDTRVLHT